ncbi:chorion class B protein M2410-like [Leguminivora glycinivorella]|uniref:chorion class B protein M2410-like n=1 Tax=Leguminivora glycinivorella TaxID=1035111 RepID=UPI00200D836F|nr:chorion class B protein M2410-like [Leguminivora glycinivorella]
MYTRVTTIVCAFAVLTPITAQYYDYSEPPIVAFTKTLVNPEGCPISITCTCPIAPSGLSLTSDLGMQGELDVTGSMPFLTAVQMQGTLPSTGRATVEYGCGNTVSITQETGNPCGPNAKFAGGLTNADLALVRC